jgi:hypothetical protein
LAFRGHFALNGVEIANSSRVAAHVGATIPESDLGLFGEGSDCSLTPIAPGRLLAEMPPTSVPIAPGRLLGTIPDGSRLYGPGLAVVGDCWDTSNLCFGCRASLGYDDSWTGLQDYLQDVIYRPELAPWYTTRLPESGEFGGIWVLDVKGLDTAPTQRDIVEMAGDGGSAGPHRYKPRTVTFEALLVACTNAGLTYGKRWLNAQLASTNERTDSVLRYFDAHPGHSAVDPATLVREVHGVVTSSGVETVDASVGMGRSNSQATVERVRWEMVVTHPYAYSMPMEFDLEWETITTQPTQWVHGGDCRQPESCDPMPILFGTECEIEQIKVVSTPPPSCGGCMPVCGVQERVAFIPSFEYPMRARTTAVTVTIQNIGPRALTMQGYLRRCNTMDKCQDTRWPVQITGLPPTASITLDGISGRFWAYHDGRVRRPWGIVSTPNGAPWRPPIIDRADCWEFVALSSNDALYAISMSLADREA